MIKRIILISLILITIICFNIIADDQTQTSQYFEFPISKSEIWKINDNNYFIEGTSIVGNSLFVIKVLINDEPGPQYENVSKELAKYSIVNDYYMKAKYITINDKKINLLDSIGVAVINKKNNLIISSSKGYRFNFKVNELYKDINTENLPEKLNNLEIKNLIDKYIYYYNSNDIKSLYDLYSINGKEQISFDSFKNDSVRISEMIEKITFGNYSHYLYLGNKNGIRGYYIYYNILFTSNKLTIKEGILRIMVIDGEDGYEIFGYKYYFYNPIIK